LEALINRRGQAWRQLDPAVRDNPSIIHRPLLDTGEQRHLGFSEADDVMIFS